MRFVARWILLGVLVACAAVGPSLRQARQDEDPESAAQRLESLRARYPNDFEVRLELGVAYYKLARKALDEGREYDYTNYLGKSMAEVLEATRIEPESPSTHTWMGIITAYTDDLDGALASFKNARRLYQRGPVHHLNIAQIYIYMGDLNRAQHSVERARRLGARGAFVDIVESLAAWRRGDLVEARDLFDQAYGLNPEEVNNWDEAPVDEPIESFADFTAYCCGNHTCGPHMGKACQRMQLAVQKRELRDETLRQELVIEMERRRKLREIYEGRRDLQIEVEPAR